MQIYLCKAGEISGPFTTDQLHKMRERKEIDTNMLYWCEGMKDWERFRPQKDLEKLSAIKSDAYFPFDTGAPPPAPWEKKNIPLRIAAFLSVLACLFVFIMAWHKHTTATQAEVARSLMVTDIADKIRRDIKSGAAYTGDEWQKFASKSGLIDMDSAQTVLGSPNKIIDGGYRWIFFDRFVHPVTGLQSDMSVLFDTNKKIVAFEAYP